VTKLQQLYREQGQSPWLDNLRRGYLTKGELERFVADGIRGVTSNPTIFQKAIASGSEYDDQFRRLIQEGAPVEDAYWAMVIQDIEAALRVLRPVHDESGGEDGYVSVELAPDIARDTEGSIRSARDLHERIAEPNLFVKIPATPEGVPAVRQMVGEGRSINITLIFSLDRYDEIIEAYLSGLEACAGDLSRVNSVASFFVSRVDTEVDRRLEAIAASAGEDSTAGQEALGLRGKAAVAQAKLAYRMFRERFSGERWEGLAARGARLQRPLWASTSTKNPEYPDTMYVDDLIGPDTVNTLPDATISAFEDHGVIACTVDRDVDAAEATLRRLGEIGVDLADVSRVLEEEGVSAFAKSFDELLTTLDAKAGDLSAG
jgi:transaldolase